MTPPHLPAGQAQDAGEGATSPEAEEAPDQTGSLLEASGLPFQLQEDGLPEVAADPPRPGTHLLRCLLPMHDACTFAAQDNV